MVITRKQWERAQTAEIRFHTYDMAEGLRVYGLSYSNHFRYLDIQYDLQGKKIIEIGCAGFPALYFRTNYQGVVIEPLEIETLEAICKVKGIERIKAPVEEIDLPKCDEIWLFNVMQHIIDPELFVTKCKESANMIRYFEPINYPVCEYHPHIFTMDDFIRWFENPKLYNDHVPHFHDAECAYGVWENKL